MPKPVIFLAFANDKEDNAKYLRNLDAERKGIKNALLPLEKEGYAEVVEKVGASLSEIFDVFQDNRYQNRIVGFHYGGHADGYQLLLETLSVVEDAASGSGKNNVVGGEGISKLLADQKSLKFAFFNGCSTKAFANALQNALPVVISTESSIDDKVATDLAIRFYKGLAENLTIPKAYQQALGFLTSQYGRETRGLYRKELTEVPKAAPWTLLLNTLRRSEVDKWTLKPSTEAQKEGEAAAEQVNQFLVEPLYEALALHQPELLARNEWKNKDLRRIKLVIIESFPYPISVNLRKLFSNTPEIMAFSEARIRQLLQTYYDTRNFLAIVLLSELWEIQTRNAGFMIDSSVLEQIKTFLSQTTNARQESAWELCKSLLGEIEFGGENLFVSELADLLSVMKDENSQWHKACQFLDGQDFKLNVGEAKKVILESEEHLAVILRHLAFWVKYKLQVVKNILFHKVRTQEATYQHSILFFNHQNEALSEDERQEAQFFTDSRSVILHKSQTPIPKEYLNLSPFFIDLNSFRGAVNAQLYYYAGQVSAEKLQYQSIDNQSLIEIDRHNEFFEVKMLFDIFWNNFLEG